MLRQPHPRSKYGPSQWLGKGADILISRGRMYNAGPVHSLYCPTTNRVVADKLLRNQYRGYEVARFETYLPAISVLIML